MKTKYKKEIFEFQGMGSQNSSVRFFGWADNFRCRMLVIKGGK